MRGTENLEMEPDQPCEDNIYANTCDLDVRRRRNTSTAKANLAVRSRKYRVILILGVLLILAFLILFILTGVLFSYYKSIREEISQMNDKKIEDTISQLKSNDKNLEDEISQLKSKDKNFEDEISQLKSKVANITDDLNKIKMIINKEGSCTSCPSGWQLIKSNCYYFQANVETWTKSREECEKRNGIMLILKDRPELDSLVPTIGSGRFWLGLRRDSGDINRWLWADGSPLTFSPWNTGEPNNDKGREHCAEILGGSQSMNDRDCEDKLGYICEKAWTC